MIKRILLHFRRARAFRLINGRLAGPAHFERKAKLLRKAGFRLGNNVKIVGPMFSSAVLEIGDDVWIGRNFSAEGDGIVKIGSRCDIAPNVVIATGTHELGTSSRRAGVGKTFNVSIGDGCWLCNGCKIMTESIDSGSVVAAGAVVLKDVPDNCLVAGVPATIKKRYE